MSLRARLAQDPRLGEVLRRARLLTAEGRTALRLSRMARIESQLERMRPLRQAAFPDPPPDVIQAEERLARARETLRDAEGAMRSGLFSEDRASVRAEGIWDRVRAWKAASPREPVPAPDPLALAREDYRRACLARDRAAAAHEASLARTQPSRDALLARLNRRRDRLTAAQHLLQDEAWLERDTRVLLRAADALCRVPAALPLDEPVETVGPLHRP